MTKRPPKGKATGSSDDDDDTGELTRIVGGEAAGVAATLPDDGLCVDILALGR